MMKTTTTVMAALLGLCLCAAAEAGDAEAGKAKSGVCGSCHGQDGNSTNPMWPHLAGQPEQYLIKATKDYKSGARNDPMMAPIVAPLSDADIADLAAYYASLKQK